MTSRRSRGEGGLHWDERRQRWIATANLGFDSRGKRITRKASGTTKTDAKNKLRNMLREHEDGLTVTAANNYTVTDAVRDWLAFGLAARSASTTANHRTIAETRIIAPLGARRLRDLSADDVDRWLLAESHKVSTRTLRLMHSLLNRAMRHAMARDKVKRNVVALCDVPTGQQGRPSKSLTFEQAEAVLAAAEGSPLHAYIVMSLLTGARTEELRALHWHEVDLNGRPDTSPPIPPLGRGLPIHPRRRRHQDRQITTATRDATTLCRRSDHGVDNHDQTVLSRHLSVAGAPVNCQIR